MADAAPLQACVAADASAASSAPEWNLSSFFFLGCFCVALTVHYLLVRRESRLIRFSTSPPPSEAERDEKTVTGDVSPPPPPKMVIPHRGPPSSVDATAAPEGQRNSDETGEVYPNPETLASAMALAQRVRDLGLHLGDIMVSGLSLGLPNGET
eukprot:678732-Prymnesium_polylepis.1